ncbi:hypothetical protein SAMN02799630_04143 [Paenibacillus sp. UNCCL117]|uniref:hypothetical protein n=1 Tax=unclassified Paenibacillus TaxID=185978 RepID=UPI00088F6025|nr:MULTISPECIES: hypothetical protein [unclassified Paenibacillus]SDD85666.1 hypothetical protein SAMN04488602_114109 [Paenibacillus sp. cl123]SFW54332.1 hypothetical protein SAMN02799630_04143 [Paenibacillus sp. UNCCL117]
MSVIPAAKSRTWAWWTVAMIAATTGAIWLIRFGLLGQEWRADFAFRYFLLAAAIGLLTGISGWFGARWVWGSTTVGTIAGLILMAAYTGNMDGWQDLVSLLMFFMAAGAGLVIGVLAELIAFGLRVRRTKQ